MGRNGVGATLPSQPPAHGPGSAPFFPQTWLINYEDIFDLSLCLTRRILIKIPLGVRQLPQRHKPDARLPSVTNDLLRNSDPAKWAQPCALDISSAFQQPHHHALWPLPAAAGEFNGCASKSFHRYLSKCLYSARVNGWRSSHPAWLPPLPHGDLSGEGGGDSTHPSPTRGCWGGPHGCPYLYAGIPGLAIMTDSRWKRPSPKYLQERRGSCRRCETAAPGHPFPSLWGVGVLGGQGRPLTGRKGAPTERQKQSPGAAPSPRLVTDIAASISNRISSQQLHFKAFHSAALME